MTGAIESCGISKWKFGFSFLSIVPIWINCKIIRCCLVFTKHLKCFPQILGKRYVDPGNFLSCFVNVCRPFNTINTQGNQKIVGLGDFFFNILIDSVV